MENKTAIEKLYDVVLARKNAPAAEGSYTQYLFGQGIDKILKKVGEECAEVLIAAKNHDPKEIAFEISDLAYHLMVLMVNEGVTVEDVTDILEEKAQKTGNLKQFKSVDKNS